MSNLWSKEDNAAMEELIFHNESLDTMEIRFPWYKRSVIRKKRNRMVKNIGEESQYCPSKKPFSVEANVTDQETAIPASELWDSYAKRNKKVIKQRTDGHKFKARFNNVEPIAISFLSDQHISGGASCDLTRMKKDAEYIRDCDGMYCCLVGDGVDNHIKHTSAMIQAKSSPDEQYQLYNHYLEILKDKIVVAVSGNHDLWTMDIAGVDMVKALAKQNKIHYSTNEAFIEVNVAGATYILAFRHQYKMGSSYNQTHAVKQWLRMGDNEFDIGAIGHHHEAALESFFYRGKETWVCRPGSYQITSYYSGKYGFNMSTPTCPTFVLFPGQREIVGFSNVYHAGAFLQYLNR